VFMITPRINFIVGMAVFGVHPDALAVIAHIGRYSRLSPQRLNARQGIAGREVQPLGRRHHLHSAMIGVSAPLPFYER
jgi:hypothetical protein